MANRPESKWENLVKSWQEYLRAQLAATFTAARAGDLIAFEGMQFTDAGLKEWIAPKLLEPVRPATGWVRTASSTNDAPMRGQVLIVLGQVGIFVRPHLQTDAVRAFRLHTLRDAVLNVLHEHTFIAVKDYAGDSSALGNLVVDRLNLDREITDPKQAEDLRHWVIGVEMRWLDRWSV